MGGLYLGAYRWVCIYPYAEVDGRKLDGIRYEFFYRDIPETTAVLPASR